ncbi:MAG: cytochrome c [Gemmatimonadales bacterium]
MPLKRLLRWLLIAVLAIVGIVALVATTQIVRFDRAARATYEVPLPPIAASADSAVLARGRHLAAALGGCLGCHGEDLGGGTGEDIGPIGAFRPGNLTAGPGGVGGNYSDGQLARAIRNGIRADGTSLRFMPTVEFNWWSDSDLLAIVSFVRSLPPVAREIDPSVVRPLGKILDRFGMMQLLSAETVDHEAPREEPPAPEPTARYGQFLALGCKGCHGEQLSGGRIPGAPSSLPIPRNLTPHETGLGAWTKEQFVTLLETGVRPDGTTLDPFMPIQTTRAMTDLEKTALWTYLRSLEPLPFGGR